MPKATFFYNLKRRDYLEKNKSDAALIKRIFLKHNKNYGLKRIKIELENKYGIKMNIKKIKRIKKELGLRTKIKRGKYNSFYMGGKGQIFENLVKRRFYSKRPLEKLTTDTTEFKFSWGKAYLQVVLDMYNSEILCYVLSEFVTLDNYLLLLKKLNARYKDKIKGAILHSDQGVIYQHYKFNDYAKKIGLIRSMSEKGNCLDNALIENFFGRMKCEMFFDNETKYKNFNQFKKSLIKYINYYNNIRIKTKLKMSPILYRLTKN